MEWYYANERGEQVPIRGDELSTLVQRGAIGPDTLVWREGMVDWQPCRLARPELFASLPMPPALPYQVPQTESADGLAVASLVLGIIGLLYMCCYFAGIPFSIAAVICGHISRSRIRHRGEGKGNSLALAGLITGYVGIALLVISVITLIVGALASSGPLTPEAAP
jgi:hypothetical protein